MSDCRDLIAEEKGMEQYCHCQSCGSKAELNENSEGTLWYKCTECGWFGLKYSEEKQIDSPHKSTLSLDRILEIAQDCGVIITEGTGIKFENECKYCEVGNTFSGYGVSLISKPYISIGIAKQEIGNEYYLITNEYEELSNIHGLYSNSPFKSDKIKINYCTMCGRKL